MTALSQNLRYLRDQNKLTQKGLSDILHLNRGRYAKYEEEGAEPPIEILKRIGSYYQISIDLLISSDLRKVPKEEIRLVESVICKFR